MSGPQAIRPKPQPAAHSTGMFARIRRLGINSGVYILGNLLTRGLVFLLVPIFTRVLTPAEYGILAIAMTVSTLLATAVGLGVDGAITQMYFRYTAAEDHCSLYGTLLMFLLTVSILMGVSLEILGRAGWLDVFPGVSFQPYLEITVWTACVSVFLSLLQSIYMTLQQPLKAVTLGFTSSLATVVLSLYLVVYRRQGVMGSLSAAFISGSVMAVVAITLTVRMASKQISWSKLKAALIFGVPTVPHMMAHWMLSLSDRLILGLYVSTEVVGLYSLGYQVGALVVLFSGALMNAFAPLINSQLSDEHTREGVPALGTYALLAIVTVGLSVALCGDDLIRQLAAPRFYAARVVVPWVALGYVFHGVYLIWSRGTWFSMRTIWMPLLTILAGALNVCLNLWLIPHWGIIAAAFNTVVAYGVLALLHGYLAQKLYPIPWEYRRWAKILSTAVVCFVIGRVLRGDNGIYNLLLEALVLCGVFPISLILVGFLKPNEERFLRSLPSRFPGYLVRGGVK